MLGYQLLDNNLITPRIMGKQMRIHPGLVFLSLMAGVVVFGFLGFFITLPLLAAIRVVFRYWKESRTPFDQKSHPDTGVEPLSASEGVYAA